MVNGLDLGGPCFSPPKEPGIRYRHPAWKSTDDPDRIRWRAMWDEDSWDSLPCGIELLCFPVIRHTARAAWIDPDAIWQGDHWFVPGIKPRLLHNGSQSAWAKPTQHEALRSLGIRLMRWSRHVRRDVDRLNAACDVAADLLSRPVGGDEPSYAVFRGKHDSARALRITYGDGGDRD